MLFVCSANIQFTHVTGSEGQSAAGFSTTCPLLAVQMLCICHTDIKWAVKGSMLTHVSPLLQCWVVFAATGHCCISALNQSCRKPILGCGSFCWTQMVCMSLILKRSTLMRLNVKHLKSRCCEIVLPLNSQSPKLLRFHRCSQCIISCSPVKVRKNKRHKCE